MNMQIEFRRSGARHYAVKVLRPGHPPLEKTSAPGYDDLLPHDLVHLVVERELGLAHGIFGQAAAGGSGGLFMPTDDPSSNSRERTRARREFFRRSDKLMREGKRDTATSEAAAYVARLAWDARRARRSEPASVVLPPWLDARALGRICDAFDELSALWRQLAIGETIRVAWTRYDRVDRPH